MTFGEKLKTQRKAKGVSQEKLAERIGVSRQAVAKWEGNLSYPSAENLLALSAILGVSLDDLAKNSTLELSKDKSVQRANLIRTAIMCNSAALNLCILPWPPEDSSYLTSLWVRLVLLLLSSLWMAWNLKYETNVVQYRKNSRIEFLYCVTQAIIAVTARRRQVYFLGAVLLMFCTLVYIILINPKYMNRVLVKRRDTDKQGKAAL